MKQRATEVLFSHKLLLLLPLLVIVPLTILITLRPKPQHWQTFATIWVDQYKPLYQDDRLGYTPATNQARLLDNFIHTRSFAVGVLQHTQLASMLSNPATEPVAIHTYWQSIEVAPAGETFLRISVVMPTPDLAYEVADATVSTYQSLLRDRLQTQSKVAIQLYADKLSQAEKSVADARNELSAYLKAHPELTNRPSDRSSDPLLSASALDPNLARLTVQVSNEEQSYSALRRQYDAAQSAAAAGIEGQQLAFSIVDPPQRPLAPLAAPRTGLIKLPLIGLVLGLVLSSAVGVFLVLTNRDVLGMHDVQGIFGVPILGEIPPLRRRRWPWQRAPRDAVRLRLTAPALPNSSVPDGAGAPTEGKRTA